MRFVVAGGGVAGLATGLAVGRSGHEAVVLERDDAAAGDAPLEALDDERRGIAHYHQPHAFLPRGRERYELACAIDDAGARRWAGETLDVGRRDGCYPLFAFATALAAAAHDDRVLRPTVRRIGLLDRTGVFDGDEDLHRR